MLERTNNFFPFHLTSLFSHFHGTFLQPIHHSAFTQFYISCNFATLTGYIKISSDVVLPLKPRIGTDPCSKQSLQHALSAYFLLQAEILDYIFQFWVILKPAHFSDF